MLRYKPHNHADLRTTTIGKIAQQYWEEISKRYPFVELYEFVIMPNHVHGLLYINNEHKGEWKPNTFGPQSQNLAAIIRGFKASVKRFANEHGIVLEWQSKLQRLHSS